jgi:hypothetical protein
MSWSGTEPFGEADVGLLSFNRMVRTAVVRHYRIRAKNH